MKKKVDFGKMTFELFKEMARDGNLSVYEKIGFPDSYRKNQEKKIFKDISGKLGLTKRGIKVLDIGCGCSDLVKFIVTNAKRNTQKLHLIDSAEMLALVKSSEETVKHALKYPDSKFDKDYSNYFDCIIIYSVLQHVILDMNPFTFIDSALGLLRPGGMLLLGDLPNISMRNRFFLSDTGIRFHKKFTGLKTKPTVQDSGIVSEKIDDSLVLSILLRYRIAGFHTYVFPQSLDLPMSNRREDILICKL